MPETSVLTPDEGHQLLAEIQALRLRLEAIEKNLAMRVGSGARNGRSRDIPGDEAAPQEFRDPWMNEPDAPDDAGEGGEFVDLFENQPGQGKYQER